MSEVFAAGTAVVAAACVVEVAGVVAVGVVAFPAVVGAGNWLVYRCCHSAWLSSWDVLLVLLRYVDESWSVILSIVVETLHT